MRYRAFLYTRLFLLVVIATFLRAKLSADISSSIQSVTITNAANGILIASDAANGADGYDRDALAVRTSVLYSRRTGTGASTNFVYEYQYKYRLLDSSGNAVDLIIPGLPATTNTVLTSTLVVDRSSTNIFINLPTIRFARLTPAVRLDPDENYRVELQLARRVSGTLSRFVDVNDPTDSDPARFLHFTNTDPADGAYNVFTRLTSVAWDRAYMVNTDADKNAFRLQVGWSSFRYDAYTTAPANSSVLFRFNIELFDASNGTAIPLEDSSINVSRLIASHAAPAGQPRVPATNNLSATISFRPAPGVQLDSPGKTYRVRVTVGHFEAPLALFPTLANSGDNGPRRLMQFNGRLLFGGIGTQFTSIANDPASGVVTPTSITTTLAVDNNSGSIIGSPSHVFGDGTPLAVRLLNNGDAELTAGTVSVTGPSPDAGEISDVRFVRGVITLSTGGARADIAPLLPTGFGLAPDTAGNLLLGFANFTNVPLTQALAPAVNPSATFPAPWWGVEETKPMWMEVSGVQWFVNSGRFVFPATGQARYVRKDEYDLLQAAPVSSADKLKRSNELYYLAATGLGSPNVVVDTDGNGAAQLTTTFKFGPGAFLPHFPLWTVLVWTNDCEQVVSRDLVATNSSIQGFAGLSLAYNRNCPDGDCGPGVAAQTVVFRTGDNTLGFTRDGGMASVGKLSAPRQLQWGRIDTSSVSDFAHRTDEFVDTTFHMAGNFLRGDQSALAAEIRPAVILYTGFTQPESGAPIIERPGEPDYADGFADYAGLNFRAVSPGEHKGHSYLAGKPTGDYPLTGRSKYYIRFPGVSGIHEAVFGDFPPDFVLYGYPVKFSNFGLAFLDSLNVDSRTEGSLRVPGPSDFIQNFDELKFGCRGELKNAKVPADEGGLKKVLVYWQADFYTRAIKFDRKASASCDPGQGSLVLGVEAFAGPVDSSLFGELGFHPNGNLITLADCQQPDGPLDPPFDSRLKLPNNFKLKGPKEEKYAFSPVNDAYFSNWRFRNQNSYGVGFMNIAGKMDVPFFEDLRVHMHSGAKQGDTNPAVALMGGWPSQGFEIGGQHFFTQNPFDTDNRGFPATVDVRQYREGFDAPDARYRVRAVRNWLDVVTFEVPLKWSPSTRAFTTFSPVTTDLLVVNAEYQAKYLSAENAELTFGIEYQGIPQVNLANMAFDQLTGLEQAFQDVVSATIISQGFKGLDQLLDSVPKQLFDPVLDQLLNPVVDNLFNALNGQFNAATKQFNAPPLPLIQQYCGVAAGVPNNIRNRISNSLLGSGINDAAGLLKQLHDRLDAGAQGLQQIESLLEENPSGNRQLVTKLLKQLVPTLVSQATDSPIVQSLAGVATDFAGGALDPQLNEFLKTVDPTLDQIRTTLATIRGGINQAKTQLENVSEFQQELTTKLNALAGEATSVATKVCGDIDSLVKTYQPGIDNPFTPANAAAFKAAIRQKIGDRFYGSVFPTTVTQVLKQRIYDLDSLAREATDSVFQQVNGIMRGFLSQTLAEVDNSINGFLGPINDAVGAGRLNGYAHINGDSLKELRLDVYAQLKVPSEMEFNAYLLVRELDSDNEENGCIGPGEKATEVRLGAKDVKLGFVGSDMTVSVEAKFTFRTAPSFQVMGMGAGFDMNGELEFATFKITYLGAQAAFGAQENYFSAACALEFNSYKAKGGIFFGRTCTLDPFFWDTDVQGIIGKPPFTGVYAYGEVWIPVSEALLGIPASCFFEVSAGVGLGAGFFVEGPTFVGKMLLGCSGSVLCLASLEGQVKLVGVKNADGLQLKGSGTLEGCLGPCPFCLCASKTVGITYKNGSWDVDF
jgi:hypothetical protein